MGNEQSGTHPDKPSTGLRVRGDRGQTSPRRHPPPPAGRTIPESTDQSKLPRGPGRTRSVRTTTQERARSRSQSRSPADPRKPEEEGLRHGRSALGRSAGVMRHRNKLDGGSGARRRPTETLPGGVTRLIRDRRDTDSDGVSFPDSRVSKNSLGKGIQTISAAQTI